MSLDDRFSRLGTDHAPGQEVRLNDEGLGSLQRGSPIPGERVDFSHGDVDAFPPPPAAFEAFSEGVRAGARQAYTEYRGSLSVREFVAAKLEAFTGAPVDATNGMILTPGTQGALFLAVASSVARGVKVAIVQPDYFANRKLVDFFEGEIFSVRLDYMNADVGAGLNLDQLEDAFRKGAKVLIFSNPNNPTGAVYSKEEIFSIASLADRYGATVIVDQLYSRLCYDNVAYTHLRASGIEPANVMTVMGPSKTESLSGYRLGVAFGAPKLIERMEKLQAIVSLRAPGYNQAVLATWFDEPQGWMADRIAKHQAIRDELVAVFTATEGVGIKATQAGSYVFPSLPKLVVPPMDFVRILRLQANAIVTPGIEFGAEFPSSIRLNFSQDHQAAVAAVKRITALVERYRP